MKSLAPISSNPLTRSALALSPLIPPLPEAGIVRVTFHNDPFTTMELVVEILKTVFGKTEVDASVVMMRAHSEGSMDIGTMPASEAREKIAKALERAAAEGAPLRITAQS